MWRYWKHLVTRVSDFVAFGMEWGVYESCIVVRPANLCIITVSVVSLIMLFSFKYHFFTWCMVVKALAERPSGVERRDHDAVLPLQLAALFTFNRTGSIIGTLLLTYYMLYGIFFAGAHACLGFHMESHQLPWRFDEDRRGEHFMAARDSCVRDSGSIRGSKSFFHLRMAIIVMPASTCNVAPHLVVVFCIFQYLLQTGCTESVMSRIYLVIHRQLTMSISTTAMPSPHPPNLLKAPAKGTVTCDRPA